MHAYVGEREEGRTMVWVVERPERPEVSEVIEVLADLQRLREERDPWSDTQSEEFVRRRADYLARKDALVARTRAAESAPERVAVVHQWTGSAELYDWGNRSAGATALARSVLNQELGQRVPADVFRRFRDEVVARLPASGFELRAAAVWEWIAVNRELVDHEVFLTPPSEAIDPPATALVARDDGAGRMPDVATASALVRACEDAWADIRSHHPELPDAVMILGTGVERGRLVKLGHWWGGRWLADGAVRGEVLLAGEALHLAPEEVFEVLLHEAAHGLNAARGVKDTSRGGRYHNQRFSSAAKEVLLDVKAMPPYGLASTSLLCAGRERYGDTVERLGEAMRIVRQLEREARVGGGAEGAGGGQTDNGAEAGGGAGGRGRGSVVSSCGCGRRMRMAPSVLAAGSVLCGVCGTEFAPSASRVRSPEVETGASRAVAEGRPLPGADVGPPPPAVDPSQAAAWARRREAIEAALVESEASGEPLLRPLQERREVLDVLLGAQTPDRPNPKATAQQVAGLRELEGIAATEDDRRAVDAWYERFGTYEEQPLAPPGPFERDDREAMARALLKADGSLTGPAVVVNGREVIAGDRVMLASDPERGLDEGVPGTVREVDAERGTVDIDIATWGRLRASLTEAVAQSMRHDYVAPVEAAAGGPDARRLDLEVQRIVPEVEP